VVTHLLICKSFIYWKTNNPQQWVGLLLQFSRKPRPLLFLRLAMEQLNLRPRQEVRLFGAITLSIGFIYYMNSGKQGALPGESTAVNRTDTAAASVTAAKMVAKTKGTSIPIHARIPSNIYPEKTAKTVCKGPSKTSTDQPHVAQPGAKMAGKFIGVHLIYMIYLKEELPEPRKSTSEVQVETAGPSSIPSDEAPPGHSVPDPANPDNIMPMVLDPPTPMPAQRQSTRHKRLPPRLEDYLDDCIPKRYRK